MLNPLSPIFEQAREWIIDPTAPGAVEAADGNGLLVLGPLLLFVAICVVSVFAFNRGAPADRRGALAAEGQRPTARWKPARLISGRSRPSIDLASAGGQAGAELGVGEQLDDRPGDRRRVLGVDDQRRAPVAQQLGDRADLG